MCIVHCSLTTEELASSLKVTTADVTGTVSGLVSCVGCRRSVETLYQTLSHSGDTALEPLTISPKGVVSVNR